MDHLVWGDGTPIESGKMLQLYVRRQPILVIDSAQYAHHAMLEWYLKREGIPFKKEFADGTLRMPNLQGRGYHLVGAGNVSLQNGTLTLWGQSYGYRLTPHQEHIDALNKIPLQFRVGLQSPAPARNTELIGGHFEYGSGVGQSYFPEEGADGDPELF